MTNISKLLVTVSGTAIALAPIPALAAPVGTAANVDITNTVTVNYQVGGVSQTAINASDTFKVDRKIDVLVQTLDTAAIQVNPGQTSAVTTFRVTNNSNATIDLLLAAANQSGDDFNVTNMQVWIDTNNNGVYDIGTDVQASSISQLASGDSARVFILADMVISTGPTVLPTDGQNAIVSLMATAASGVTAGTAITGATGASTGTGGTAITQTPPATPNGKNTMETVFADAAGVATGDVVRDGRHSAQSTYTVLAARLTVTKASTVISDPTGGAQPKAIPGAVIEYCILVTNAAGGATATNLAITDPVPSQLVPLGTFTPSVRGAVASPADACTATQSGTGAIAGQNVSGTLPNLTAGQAAALVFRATIQ